MFYQHILSIKSTYTDEQKKRDAADGELLFKRAENVTKSNNNFYKSLKNFSFKGLI